MRPRRGQQWVAGRAFAGMMFATVHTRGMSSSAAPSENFVKIFSALLLPGKPCKEICLCFRSL